MATLGIDEILVALRPEEIVISLAVRIDQVVRLEFAAETTCTSERGLRTILLREVGNRERRVLVRDGRKLLELQAVYTIGVRKREDEQGSERR